MDLDPIFLSHAQAFDVTLDCCEMAEGNLQGGSRGLAFPLLGVMVLIVVLMGARRANGLHPSLVSVLRSSSRLC